MRRIGSDKPVVGCSVADEQTVQLRLEKVCQLRRVWRKSGVDSMEYGVGGDDLGGRKEPGPDRSLGLVRSRYDTPLFGHIPEIDARGAKGVDLRCGALGEALVFDVACGECIAERIANRGDLGASDVIRKLLEHV